jgi:hypothetical protein
MARVEKVDNFIKKRFLREEQKRKIDIREKKIYFLIVCEGEKTEPAYFRALEKSLPKGAIELEIDGSGLNTLGLVAHAIKYRDRSCRNFDRVWVVFDRDEFPEDNFDNAIAKATANNINCAWSNQAFELWFVLHFQFVNTPTDREDYKKTIEKEVVERSGNKAYKYEKNDPKTFALLKKHGDIMQAVRWASKLIASYDNTKRSSHNPGTTVHELINELTNPRIVLDLISKEDASTESN